MNYDPMRHHRRSVRLKGYDYAAPGAYFVTLCTRQREMFFDQAGVRALAETCWRTIPAHAAGVALDEWVVMPNHLHGIIVIQDQRGMDAGDQGIINDRRGVQLNAPTTNDRAEKTRDPDDVFSMMSPRRGTLSVVVRTYKAAVTTACRAAGHAAFGWQRGFYEHVVRHARELEAIRRYIRDNPRRWALDRDNLANARGWPPPVAVGDYLAELAAYDRETP